MQLELKSHFQIESARYLPNLPKTHPCAHMHGHSFKIVLSLMGDIDPAIGWVIDYNDINAAVKPILGLIDHKVLNEVPGLENPTSELLAVWLYERIKKVLPQLRRVTVAETPLTECSYPA